MLVLRKRFSLTAFTGLVALGLATAAHGQNANFRVGGNMAAGQNAGVSAVLGQANVPGAAGLPYINPYTVPYGQGPIIAPGLYGGTATITSSPYGTTQTASSPYGGGGYNPYFPGFDTGGGYLRGVADVTNANAQYQVTIQQARLTQSQADMAKLDLRRRIFDEARYERMMTPTPEDVRIANMNADLNRARREPPLTEIWSGKALNDLYLYLAGQQAKGNRGPNIPLDEDMLKRVNLTSGVGGNIGILKDDGKLQWPLSLLNPEFMESRKRFERNADEIVKRLKFGNSPEAATLKDMQAEMKRLRDTLAKSVGELSPTQFIEAQRYLNHLDDAVKALQDPNVGNFFNQKWNAKGRSVAELIKSMSDQGLRFAPAAPGDEPAYRALHQALNAYDAGIAQLTAGQK